MNLELFCVCFELQFRMNVYLQNEVEKIQRKKVAQVLPRLELGSLDSESKVLTITP